MNIFKEMVKRFRNPPKDESGKLPESLKRWLESDFQVLGAIVETRYYDRDNKPTKWEIQWNHKMYTTLPVAEAAIKQMVTYQNKQEFRVRMVYVLKETDYA